MFLHICASHNRLSFFYFIHLFEDSVSHLPEHNEEIELSIEFPVVMMVGSTIWTSHWIFQLFRRS